MVPLLANPIGPPAWPCDGNDDARAPPTSALSASKSDGPLAALVDICRCQGCSPPNQSSELWRPAAVRPRGKADRAGNSTRHCGPEAPAVAALSLAARLWHHLDVLKEPQRFFQPVLLDRGGVAPFMRAARQRQCSEATSSLWYGGAARGAGAQSCCPPSTGSRSKTSWHGQHGIYRGADHRIDIAGDERGALGHRGRWHEWHQWHRHTALPRKGKACDSRVAHGTDAIDAIHAIRISQPHTIPASMRWWCGPPAA